MSQTSVKSDNTISPTNYVIPIIIIGILFFIFGFVTWLNGILIPYLKIACELNNFESYFVAFSFYISYFVMAIPSSWVLKKIGFKNGMSVGLLVMAVGALIFIPAATTRTYGLFLTGLFILGTGLAILQTASNPYIAIIGPIESAAKRIGIMGICNKVAAVISPLILGAIILKDSDILVKQLSTMDAVQKIVALDDLASRAIVPYLILAIALAIFAAIIKFSTFPDINTDNENEAVAAANVHKTNIFQFPQLILGVLALFFYVGVEVIAGDTIVSYGISQGIEISTAKTFTSYTMATMVIGYILGIIAIPKIIRQETALYISAILGVVFSLAAHLTSGFTSVMFIAALGFANSMMWPAIWPLAIDGLGRFTKIGSSLLIMAIAGGALFPLLYGRLADIWDPQMAYWIIIPGYLYIFYYAVAGHKIRRWSK